MTGRWIIMDDAPTEGFIGPPRPTNCVDGWCSHTWRAHYEDGSLSLTTDECNLCDRGMEDVDPWMLSFDFPARLTFYKEMYGAYGQDMDAWFDIEPIVPGLSPSEVSGE